jgi:hypothetical protein
MLIFKLKENGYSDVDEQFDLITRAFSLLCLSGPHPLGSSRFNLLHSFVVAHHNINMLL